MGPAVSAVLVLLALSLAGAVVIGVATRRILHRLGLDPLLTLAWLGLAEEPIEKRKHRRRLKELLEAPSAPPTRAA